MAIKGLSKPFYAKYKNTAGVITYEDGGVVGEGISWGVTTERSEDNHLYADNGIAETDKGKFTKGELTLGTSGLGSSIAKIILGLKTETITPTEGEPITVNVYDDDAESPDLGFGIIELHQEDDVDKYKAIILCRVYFGIPAEAATTKGESVAWQTPTITAAIMRSESVVASGENHPWKKDAWFDTEAEAETFIKSILVQAVVTP